MVRQLASPSILGRGWAVDCYIAEVSMEHLPGCSLVMDTDYEQVIQVMASPRAPQHSGHSLILQGHVDVVPESLSSGRGVGGSCPDSPPP